MWDRSKKENVDAHSAEGFHYELQVVTREKINEVWKAKAMTWAELGAYNLDLIALTPEAGHTWWNTMGNIKDYAV
jgi:hypothetical protein